MNKMEYNNASNLRFLNWKLIIRLWVTIHLSHWRLNYELTSGGEGSKGRFGDNSFEKCYVYDS